MVRRHLKHREARHRQGWAQGQGWTPESQAVVALLFEIEDLQFEDIAAFYDSDEPVSIEPTEFSVFVDEEMSDEQA